MDLTVRYADIKDCAALGKVQSESWRAAYKGLVNDSVLDSMSPETALGNSRTFFRKAGANAL